MPGPVPLHAPDACGSVCCSMRRVGSCASQSGRVQAGAWSSWREPSIVKDRTCTADVRVAHRGKRCHIEVGAPAKQDCRAAVVRHMSRRPRTETSSWYVDPWSPLCPSIADHHGIDERSRRGVYPDSRAGTKVVLCHRQYMLCSPLVMPRMRVRRGRGVLCHRNRAACGVTLSHGEDAHGRGRVTEGNVPYTHRASLSRSCNGSNVTIAGEAKRIRRWRYAIVAKRARLCQAARRPGGRVG